MQVRLGYCDVPWGATRCDEVVSQESGLASKRRLSYDSHALSLNTLHDCFFVKEDEDANNQNIDCCDTTVGGTLRGLHRHKSASAEASSDTEDDEHECKYFAEKSKIHFCKTAR